MVSKIIQTFCGSSSFCANYISAYFFETVKDSGELDHKTVNYSVRQLVRATKRKRTKKNARKKPVCVFRVLGWTWMKNDADGKSALFKSVIFVLCINQSRVSRSLSDMHYKALYP